MKKGFTLIELAIVVVVLGILITGIVGGQSLIESAKKREVIAGFTQLRTGLNAFKLEFDAIPGDMEDAYDYWGADCDAPRRNCEGDGDGKITGETQEFDKYCYGSEKERCMFLKHMSLAGILKKAYVGEGGPFEPNNSFINPLNEDSYFFASNRCKKNVNFACPTARNYTSKLYLMSAGINLTGDKNSPWLSCAHRAAFTPKQQKYLDEKLDDGKPKTGRVVATPVSGLPSGGCHNSTIASGPCLLNNTENAYNVANDDYVCQMHYRLDL
jgi:prepilin-type N-terminal cleavage/methylation domain-containing protein